MRKPLFDKSESMLKRIDKLETVVGRLTRRSGKTKSAMITPYPISSCFTGEINGQVLKYMFSARGVITKGQVSFNVKPKAGVVIALSLSNDMGETKRAYNVATRSAMLDPNMEVYSGDKLIISATLVDPEKEKDKEQNILLNEVWCSFLWVPFIGDTKVKQFLLDEIDSEDLEEHE